MLEQAVFNLMLACFTAHELDAVDKREWRLLYVLRSMDEARARILFSLLHIPLAAIVLSLVYLDSSDVAIFSRLLIDAFAMMHLYLHWRLRNHAENRFAGASSCFPIVGAALLGGLHVCLTILQSSAR